MKLKSAQKRYLHFLSTRNHSDRHQQTVRYRTTRFISFTGNLQLKSINKHDLSDFFKTLEDTGSSRGTLAGYKSTLKAWFNWLRKKHHLKKNLSKQLTGSQFNYSYSPVKSTAVPIAHLKRVIDCLPSYLEERGCRPRDLRDVSLVSLCIDSGARRGELRNIRKVDITRSLQEPAYTTNGQTIYHTHSHGKTGHALIRYFPETAVYLHDWLEYIPPRSPFLFINLNTGRRLQPDSMRLALKRICQFAEVPTFLFHAIRKRNITQIIRLSGDQKVGQIYAGHSSSTTTQQYYNMVQNQYVDDAAAQLSQQLRPNGRQLAFSFFDKT